MSKKAAKKRLKGWIWYTASIDIERPASMHSTVSSHLCGKKFVFISSFFSESSRRAWVCGTDAEAEPGRVGILWEWRGNSKEGNI